MPKFRFQLLPEKYTSDLLAIHNKPKLRSQKQAW